MDNAPERVFAAGATYTDGPLSATLRLRYLGPRDMDTYGTLRSRANTVLNLGVRYAASPALTLGVDVFNVTGRKANDIEYLYASCTASRSGARRMRQRHRRPPRAPDGAAQPARDCEVDVLGAASA